MKDYNPEKPIIQHKLRSDSLVIYQAANPRVLLFELNVLEEIGQILNYRPNGVMLAREVIRRLNGENKSFSITDVEFAEKLRINIRKFKRAKENLIEDQQLSNFRFIWIPPRKVVEKNGVYFGVPTKYQPGQYWNASITLKAQTEKIDIFAMSPMEAQKEVRELLKLILDDFDAKTITREKSEKEKDKKEKSPSLPCKCDCAPCAQCAKSATASEANGREALRKIPNEVLEVELDKFADFFERYLRECGAIDKKFTYAVKRAHHALEMAEASASDLIIREDTGQQLRLVGGQPR